MPICLDTPEGIWVGRILPFLGPGQYLIVSLVCKALKDYYAEYIHRLPKPVVVRLADSIQGQLEPCHTLWKEIYTGRGLAAEHHEEVQRHHNGPVYYTAHAIGLGGSPEVLKWWQDENPDWNHPALSAGAARNGNISLLRVATATWDHGTTEAAASSGRLRTLRWLTNRPFQPCPLNIIGAARTSAFRGHVNILEWLFQRAMGTDSFSDTRLGYLVVDAAYMGHLNVAKWAAKIYMERHSSMDSFPWQEGTICTACRGRADYFLWCMEHGCPMLDGAFWEAVTVGNTPILNILAGLPSCPWPRDTSTCWLAAKDGHLEWLQCAHDNGYPWDQQTCWIAAKNGHLHCLQYAHETGCPWNQQTCHDAARHDQFECLIYALENGCPWDPHEILRAAATSNNLDLVVYVHSKGGRFSSRVSKIACNKNNLEMLIYCVENGCPLHPQAGIIAAGKRNDAILDYLTEKGWQRPGRRRIPTKPFVSYDR